MVRWSETSVTTIRLMVCKSYRPNQRPSRLASKTGEHKTPNRAAASLTFRQEDSVASSPMRYAFHRFTPVVSSDLSPLQLLVLLGWKMVFDLVELELVFCKSKSPSRCNLWKWIKNLYLKSILMGIIWNSLKYEVTWPPGGILNVIRRADFWSKYIWSR